MAMQLRNIARRTQETQKESKDNPIVFYRYMGQIETFELVAFMLDAEATQLDIPITDLGIDLCKLVSPHITSMAQTAAMFKNMHGSMDVPTIEMIVSDNDKK